VQKKSFTAFALRTESQPTYTKPVKH